MKQTCCGLWFCRAYIERKNARTQIVQVERGRSAGDSAGVGEDDAFLPSAVENQYYTVKAANMVENAYEHVQDGEGK